MFELLIFVKAVFVYRTLCFPQKIPPGDNYKPNFELITACSRYFFVRGAVGGGWEINYMFAIVINCKIIRKDTLLYELLPDFGNEDYKP